LKWHLLGHEIRKLCHIVELSRASFYRLTSAAVHQGNAPLVVIARKHNRCSYDIDGAQYDDNGLKDLLNKIVAGEGYNYGYRKLTFCLRMHHHIHINKKKVYRLCKESELLKPARKSRKKAPRMLARNRIINGPNQLWQGDIKYGYIHGEERNFYILSYIDVFDRTIVGYRMGINCLSQHAGQALKQGLMKRQLYNRDQQLIVRTDNGPQFTSLKFASDCHDLGIIHERIPPKTPNMNAYIEAYHSILEDDFMQQMIFESFDEALTKLERYVKYYNKVRIHGSLGYLSPEQYNNLYNQGLLPPVEIRL
jgi:putative transposase